MLTLLSVPDLLDPYNPSSRLERNLKNAGQDEDHFAALPWILSSWPGTSDSLGSSASQRQPQNSRLLAFKSLS